MGTLAVSLLLYVAVIVIPVGSKLSPVLYAVLLGAPDTAILLSASATTEIADVSYFPLPSAAVAVIVALPALLAVTNPFELTLAILELEEDQFKIL